MGLEIQSLSKCPFLNVFSKNYCPTKVDVLGNWEVSILFRDLWRFFFVLYRGTLNWLLMSLKWHLSWRHHINQAGTHQAPPNLKQSEIVISLQLVIIEKLSISANRLKCHLPHFEFFLGISWGPSLLCIVTAQIQNLNFLVNFHDKIYFVKLQYICMVLLYVWVKVEVVWTRFTAKIIFSFNFWFPRIVNMVVSH